MVSSLPQRSGHLRVRYRALLLDAWGRPEATGAPLAAAVRNASDQPIGRRGPTRAPHSPRPRSIDQGLVSELRP